MAFVTATRQGSYAHLKLRKAKTEEFGAFLRATKACVYDKGAKRSTLPVRLLPLVIGNLRGVGIRVVVDEDLAGVLAKSEAQAWVDGQGANERIAFIDGELGKEGKALYPFQKTGVRWLIGREAGLLADEMGTGKTCQSICAIPPRVPVIVVCPAALKGTWQAEFRKFRKSIPVHVCKPGASQFRLHEPGELLAVVTNYESLPEVHTDACLALRKTKRGATKSGAIGGEGAARLNKEKVSAAKRCLGCLPWLDDVQEGTVLILDEVHYTKNPDALRTSRARALAEAVRKKGGRVWGLTGTPMLNEPRELWQVYKVLGIAEEAFDSWDNFLVLFNGKEKYLFVGFREKMIGYDWGSPEAEAIERIQRVCLRRTKEDVLPDLPEKRWEFVEVAVDKKTLKICEDVLREHGGIEKIVKLVEEDKLKFETMSAVRAALATAKIPGMLELVEIYEDNEEPLVVFSAHRAPIDTLGKREGWATITGDTKDKTEIVEAFQKGEFRGLGVTIQAGGMGITLTHACNSIFVDRSFTPAMNAQAEDRLMRIGQKSACLYRILVANHVLDRRVTEVLERKSKLIKASVDAARSTVDREEKSGERSK